MFKGPAPGKMENEGKQRPLSTWEEGTMKRQLNSQMS